MGAPRGIGSPRRGRARPSLGKARRIRSAHSQWRAGRASRKRRQVGEGLGDRRRMYLATVRAGHLIAEEPEFSLDAAATPDFLWFMSSNFWSGHLTRFFSHRSPLLCARLLSFPARYALVLHVEPPRVTILMAIRRLLFTLAPP